MKEIDQVLRSKELELSQVEIEVQSLRIVAELLGEEADQEEADQEEARKLAGAILDSRPLRLRTFLRTSRPPRIFDGARRFNPASDQKSRALIHPTTPTPGATG